jgi:hypothetical protein
MFRIFSNEFLALRGDRRRHGSEKRKEKTTRITITSFKAVFDDANRKKKRSKGERNRNEKRFPRGKQQRKKVLLCLLVLTDFWLRVNKTCPAKRCLSTKAQKKRAERGRENSL